MSIRSNPIPKVSGTEEGTMENIFYTLQDFLLFTKGAAYYLMGASLLAIVGFWLFITGRDDETFIK
jgi:hypothetical protein